MFMRLLEKIAEFIAIALAVMVAFVFAALIFPPILLVPALLLLIPFEVWCVIVAIVLIGNWKYIVKGERKDDI